MGPKEVSLALVAGEVSGDMLAARLMAGLRPQLPGVRFHGIGGPRMIEQGMVSDVPLDTLTVRNLLEIIPRYRELKGIQNRLRDRLLAERPAAFIGADYPGFNLGLEEQLRAKGIPTVHFVGPQIWAWRGGRIKKIQRAVSHMLVIFPFEEKIYQDAGVPVTYIGHPLAETIPLAPDTVAARAALGLAPDARVVTIMPGSRMSELKHLTVPFIGAARLLAQRDPALRFVVPMAGEKQRALFTELLAQEGLGDVPLTLVDQDSHRAIAAADTVLAASGTATLEVALFKKPMVVAYKVKRLEWEIMRHMGYQPWIGLPNILAREFLVPELLQHAVTPAALADAVWAQLNDTALRDRLAARFLDMHHSLLRNSAQESAEAVLRVIGART
ncbi:lipid-A-disaccharide synthase [Massilia sp. Dwa41.01b]|uniref:lipid-A-disaccharide synthase n=2 Tax=unclassified Massilia TaxID=2609279 RepID=UPI00160163B2|nr:MULTISPECIES: lipid-A-disaccharide synthase [unclassified Massilia]QNA89346.1 lipid-A-disaccharide synthase [Massilia sp. Dwa41.01b]QNB01461.1 lipid-A-disaccharide synthase [Massilia sp. Se16.2.3]